MAAGAARSCPHPLLAPAAASRRSGSCSSPAGATEVPAAAQPVCCASVTYCTDKTIACVHTGGPDADAPAQQLQLARLHVADTCQVATAAATGAIAGPCPATAACQVVQPFSARMVAMYITCFSAQPSAHRPQVSSAVNQHRHERQPLPSTPSLVQITHVESASRSCPHSCSTSFLSQASSARFIHRSAFFLAPPSRLASALRRRG